MIIGVLCHVTANFLGFKNTLLEIWGKPLSLRSY